MLLLFMGTDKQNWLFSILSLSGFHINSKQQVIVYQLKLLYALRLRAKLEIKAIFSLFEFDTSCASTCRISEESER